MVTRTFVRDRGDCITPHPTPLLDRKLQVVLCLDGYILTAPPAAPTLHALLIEDSQVVQGYVEGCGRSLSTPKESHTPVLLIISFG